MRQLSLQQAAARLQSENIPEKRGGLFWCPALLTPPLAQWTLWAMLASPLGLRLRLHGGLLAWGVRGPIPQFGQ